MASCFPSFSTYLKRLVCLSSPPSTAFISNTDESTAYYAARGLHEGGLKVIKRINGNVENYNCEQEYAIVVNTIEEERRHRQEMGVDNQGWRAIARSYVDCFRGTNRIRTLACAIPTACQQLNALSLLNVYGACECDFYALCNFFKLSRMWLTLTVFFRQAGMRDAFAIKAILSESGFIDT